MQKEIIVGQEVNGEIFQRLTGEEYRESIIGA